MHYTERLIRAGLPLIRASQTLIPLPLGTRFLKWSVQHMPLGSGVTLETVSAGGVPCVWLIPGEEQPGRVLLYLHGGGFVYGVTPPHLQMGSLLAKRMSMRILMVDYRLAPAHPYPAALEDCVAAYRWLLDQGFRPRDIAVAGDSAGGNLAITLLLKLRQDGVSLPAAVVCLSPVMDLSGESGRMDGFKDPLLPARAIKMYTRSYLGSHDPHDPLISPVHADLRGLPPLLVHAGEQETLREGAIRFTQLAVAAGVDARLEVYPRMWHVWQLFMALPQAKQSLEDIARFLSGHLR